MYSKVSSIFLDFASAGDPGATDNSRKEQGAGSVSWEYGYIYIGLGAAPCMYGFLLKD